MNWTIPAIWSIGTVGAAAATHGDTFYKNGKKYERFELTDVCFVLDASGASRVSCKGK